MESTTYIKPHILTMRDEGADEECVAYVGRENALFVFRSLDEIAKFRELTGLYEGLEAVAVDEMDIARTCLRHGLTRICMPEPWTGANRAEFFDVEDFVRMLRESIIEV